MRRAAFPLEIDPALAPYIEKVSFVLGKPESVRAQLVAPDGQIISSDTPNTTLISDPRFLAVTILQPQGGTWKFITAGSGQVRARAILYSRLRVRLSLRVVFRSWANPSRSLLRMIEQSKTGELLKSSAKPASRLSSHSPDGTRESLDRFYDDGTHGDLVANDGDFTRLYAGAVLPGMYQVRVTGRKGGSTCGAGDPRPGCGFPTLVADAPQGKYEMRGQPIPLQAHLTGGEMDQGEVLARVTAPSGRQSEILLSGRDGAYSAEFIPTENGSYTVQIETRGAFYLGVPFWEAARAQFTVSLVRTLSIGPPKIDVDAGCFEQSPRVMVTLPLNSLREETIGLSIPGFTLQPKSFALAPGDQQIGFEIFSGERQFVSRR